MKRLNMERLVPAGLNVQAECRAFGLGLGISALYSLIFLFRYAQAREALFEWTLRGKALKEGAVMANFCDLMDGLLLGFVVLALSMAGVAVYHYIYHYQGSRSIYVMRRLRSRWELPRRCLAMPVMGAVSSGLIAFVLVLLYFGVYILFTPKACLQPGQWSQLWR